MENNNTYDNIIATLDRIIAMQDRIIEKMDGMMEVMDNMLDGISSANINNDAVTSMVERWDTTGPR
jgi:hypothetical protein